MTKNAHVPIIRQIQRSALIFLVVLSPNLIQAQKQVLLPPKVVVKVAETTDSPHAVVLSVHGNCEYSEDGTNFKPLKAGKVVKEGAVVRTPKDGRTDMFFRRIGTTVRVQPESEIKLEKMRREMVEEKAVMQTLLDLRAGRIFTVVRSMIPGSTLEIRNAAGRSVVEGAGGKGRYIITADGTHVADKDSAVPIKVIGQGESGITIISPGQKFDAKSGKPFNVETPEAVQALVDLDELDALAEQLAEAEELAKK